MEVLLKHTGLVNLVAAAAVLLAGLLIYFAARPRVFARHAYTKRAFEYWLLQWSAFVLIYIVYSGYPESSRMLILASADLQSMFSLGFAFVMLAGSSYRPKHVMPGLGVLFTMLLLWNVGFGGVAGRSPFGSILRHSWILPSEVVSAASLVLIAFVFIKRYGYPATSFALVIAVYMVLQRPAYDTLFVTGSEDPSWLLALAVGKVLYGCVLYSMFFLTAREYGAIALPTFGTTQPRAQQLLRWSVAVIWGMATHFIAAFAAAVLHR